MSATQALIETIKSKISSASLNNNQFYANFKDRLLDSSEFGEIFTQYFHYIRSFPKILACLAARTDNEFIRSKLSQTVLSELGGSHGKPHFEMFIDALDSIGVELKYNPNSANLRTATIHLVNGLRSIFTEDSVSAALGSHYVIEETGLPMISALYEGFRQYPGLTVESAAYFHLHLFLECAHVDWIQKALIEEAKDTHKHDDILRGAERTIELLNYFWSDLNLMAFSARNAA